MEVVEHLHEIADANESLQDLSMLLGWATSLSQPLTAS